MKLEDLEIYQLTDEFYTTEIGKLEKLGVKMNNYIKVLDNQTR